MTCVLKYGFRQRDRRTPRQSHCVLSGAIPFGRNQRHWHRNIRPRRRQSSSPTFGFITSTPKPGWANADFVGLSNRHLVYPSAFDTDVNGAALGEYRWGAAQGLDTFLYLTIGTGVGGGGMLGGKLMHGLVHPEMGHASATRPPSRFVCRYLPVSRRLSGRSYVWPSAAGTLGCCRRKTTSRSSGMGTGSRLSGIGTAQPRLHLVTTAHHFGRWRGAATNLTTSSGRSCRHCSTAMYSIRRSSTTSTTMSLRLVWAIKPGY